ncbi:cysteine-rich repeat secretory protein 38-like [Tripterygium wilfordii]|uniref:cysteine-rich repeat secretory protein 38-like n=1 Tax=Tripterygium wilfordii TaxID=458696 RepID=UPI0018F83AF0|nr:cysteine-rich repeat secretory protein 38-like [Tripterygium wilfordii]
MSLSRTLITTSFCVLSFTLILLPISVNGVGPLYHFCSTSQNNFSSHSPYETNLNNLMAYLYHQTPSKGFGLGKLGQNQDKAYGLALCRGDVSTPDCKTCVAEASSEIRKRCANNKGGVIWYDNCMLKYMDKEFFGQIDNQYKFYMWNTNNVSDPIVFNKNVKALLGKLGMEAASSSKLYSVGEMEMKGSEKLYGLAQCTRDLTSVDCKKCIDGVIGELPSCCDGKKGGRVVGGSCNVRYEIYPFVSTA